MKTHLRRVAIQLVRVAVCAGALAWVLSGLSWHDWLELSDGRRLQVVSTSAPAGGQVSVEVLDPARGRMTLTGDQVPRNADGQPRIEYGVPTVWKQSDKPRLVLSVLLFAPVSLISSLRFVLLLRAQDIRIGYWQGIKLTYAGNFLNFVMFGTTGGDLFKAVYVTKHTPHKVEAVTTVFLDRVVGLVGIVALAVAAMTLRLDDPRIRTLMIWMLGLLGVLAAGILVFYLPGLRERLRPGERFAWLPGLEALRRVDRAILRLREHPPIVLAAFGCTVLLQAIAVGSFYVWGLAMGMSPDAPSYYAYIGVSLVVASIPVTPMGLGTMEAALMFFLANDAFGTSGQVVFLALGIRLIMLAWALPGVIVPMLGAHRPSRHDLETELAASTDGTAPSEPALPRVGGEST